MDLQDVQVGSKIAVAAVLALLAAWLAALDFRNRLHRVFAMLLLLQAATLVAYGFAIGDQYASYWGRVYQHFDDAVPFAALYGAWVFARRYGSAADVPLLGNRFLVPTLLLVCAAIPQLVIFRAGAAMDTDTRDYLALVPTLGDLALVLIAYLLARAAWRQQRHVKRRALLLASLGFLLGATFSGAYTVSIQGYNWLALGIPAWTGDPYDLQADAPLLTVVAAAAVALHVLRRGRQDLRLRALANRYAIAFVLFVGAAIGAGVMIASVPDSGSWEDVAPPQIIQSLSWLALPILVTYALVKHHLFDVDVRVMKGMAWTFASGCVLASFFLVSSLAQGLFQEAGGNLWTGGVVSGLLLLFISPLERVGRRLAKRAMDDPGGVKSHEAPWTQQERSHIYREQVELAWLDGKLSAKEHLFLASLRKRLGLSHEDAARLEADVAKGP